MNFPLRTKRATIVVLVVLAVSCIAQPARASVITFVATDLADVTVGEDLWRYDYSVSGRNFLQSEFFDIYFDPTRYRALSAGPAANADWDSIALQQPNPAVLPPFDVGIFDSFALVGGPSLADIFSATYVFIGPGAPGSQKFNIYDASSNLIETGFTVRPVSGIPEPSTISLSLIGLMAFAVLFLRSYNMRRPTR